MLGISQIASYTPKKALCNYELLNDFDISELFVKEKLGFERLARSEESVSNMCVKAYERLKEKLDDRALEGIECLILVSQNTDFKIPHTSAILQDKLALSKNTACFDIGLACSGFVYGLSNILAFMSFNHLKKGLLFTCDPYSKIINPSDKNTALLFGDSASVSLISSDFKLNAKAFKFGTNGVGYEAIFCEKNELSMNGRAVFDFAMSEVVLHIESFLKEQDIDKDALDLVLVHQGSKYIVDNLAKRLKISPAKMPFLAKDYGNTVSSSLPLMLEGVLDDETKDKILITGFGAGLSLASAILQKE